VKAEDFAAEQRRFLVAISGGVAFVPPPAPRDLEAPRELARLEAEALRQIGRLEEVAAAFTVEQALFPLRLREAQLSNEIEGTHTQVEELLTAVAAPRAASSAAVQEVLATAGALETGLNWVLEGRGLSHSLVLELHRQILGAGRGSQLTAGAYRTRQVVIGQRRDTPATARFVSPPPELVRPLMDDLLEFAADERVGPVLDAGILHYQFEAIHPFEDGNGRLGRALVPLLWLARGFLERPLVYVGGYLAERRSEYMERLLRVSTDGDWTGWLAFFTRGVIAEAEGARARLKAARELLERYRQALVAATKSPTARDALPLLLERPVVTVADVQRYTGASRPAARQAIEALVQIGALRPLGRVAGAAIYLAEELERAIFGSAPAAQG